MSNTIDGVDQSRVYTGEKKAPNNDLGKDAFLNLLVTQMSNQDPLEPTSDTEFISQMANFSTLEQMQNVSASIAEQTANNMIGQDVVANKVSDSEGNLSTKDVYGRVYGVTTINDTSYLNVTNYDDEGDYLVPVSSVQQITSGSSNTVEALLGQILSQLVTSNSAAAAETYEGAETDASETNFEV